MQSRVSNCCVLCSPRKSSPSSTSSEKNSWLNFSFDDYDVFKSPLKDFKEAAEKSGWSDKIVYLDRGEEYEW